MEASSTLNCYLFDEYASFTQYVEKIMDVTGGNLSLIEECKAEVCGRLWGTGNADISGIGVSTLYSITECRV